MSHHTVLARERDRNEPVWIMEDDVAFSANAGEFERAFQSLPAGWDVFYAGHMQLPEVRQFAWTEPGIVLVPADIEFIGLHCYFLSAKAVSLVVEEMNARVLRPCGHPDGGAMPVDGAMNEIRKKWDLATYAAIPPLAYQRPSRTDIGLNRWFDRLPVVRDGANLLRRMKHAIRGLS